MCSVATMARELRSEQEGMMQAMNGTLNKRFATRDDQLPDHLHAAEHPAPRCGCAARSSVRSDMHERRRIHGAPAQDEMLLHGRHVNGPRPLAGVDHVVSRHGDGWVTAALEAVGDAVAARDWERAEALIDQLKSVCGAGGHTPPVAISSASWQPGSDDRDELLLEPLRAREMEVLSLVAAGYSNQDIAERLIVSIGTVRWHLKNIYSKLDVHSRTQAVARARATGLIT